MVKIYTGGTFDLFHSGHVNFLRRCSELGSVTVVLNTDEFIESYKGKLPIISYEDRKAVLESCRYVTEVIENTGGADSKPSILKVNPSLIVIASDWAKKDYYAQMGFTQDWLDEQGIGLCYIPYTWRISSSKIRNLLG